MPDKKKCQKETKRTRHGSGGGGKRGGGREREALRVARLRAVSSPFLKAIASSGVWPLNATCSVTIQ